MKFGVNPLYIFMRNIRLSCIVATLTTVRSRKSYELYYDRSIKALFKTVKRSVVCKQSCKVFSRRSFDYGL